jgi:DNA-binding HxlR family transcriptional regulator
MATRTAAERRAEAKAAYDEFAEACPTRQVVAVLSDKWTALLIIALTPGPRRHSELRTQLAGISQKMLTQTLRTLERDGLVARRITPTVPVRVDYELTDLGRSLALLVAGVQNWADANMDRILRARSTFEAS